MFHIKNLCEFVVNILKSMIIWEIDKFNWLRKELMGRWCYIIGTIIPQIRTTYSQTGIGIGSI